MIGVFGESGVVRGVFGGRVGGDEVDGWLYGWRK